MSFNTLPACSCLEERSPEHIISCFKEELKLVVMRRSLSGMMWRRDDGIKLSVIEVDSQGDRCSTIIQGFREGCSDDGGEGP